MDIVSEKSPTSSPPISPIKLTTHGAHHCPPSRNFPTWTRASLERAKLVKAIPRDNKERKLLLDSVRVISPSSSKSTQTTAPATQTNDSSANDIVVEYKNALINERRKLASVEKNFKFVVLHHEDVMKRLRQEVSELKSDNKDLNFRLVMTEGQVSSVQSAYHDEHGQLQCSHCKGALTGNKPQQQDPTTTRIKSSITSDTPSTSLASENEKGENVLEVKVLLLKEEIAKLKAALKDARTMNSKLNHLVEKKQHQTEISSNTENTPPALRSEGPHLPRAPPHPQEKHRPGNFGHQPLDRTPYVYYHHQQQPQRSQQSLLADAPMRNDLVTNYHGNVNQSNGNEALRLQMTNQFDQGIDIQEQEMSQANHMFLQQRLGQFENQPRAEEKLPPIMSDVSRSGKSFKSPRQREAISLPLLQPVPPPNRNLSDRQKRAKALHVQRQRNNREFTALL